MFGLDDQIAELSHGASIGIVILVAILLGLRHATDPDHIAAVTTLVASGRDNAGRVRRRSRGWWGLGHAVTLVVFGVPILLTEAYLPEPAQQAAETVVAGSSSSWPCACCALAAWRVPRARARTIARAIATPSDPARSVRDRARPRAWAAALGSASCCLRRSRPNGRPRLAPGAGLVHGGLDGGSEYRLSSRHRR